MEIQQLETLSRLLTLYRDDSVDRDEWDKRNEVLFDVNFEIESLVPPNMAMQSDAYFCPTCGGEITGVGHRCLQCEH